MTKKDVIEYYKAKLSTNEGWALRGLERIAMRQTEYELEYKLTEENRGYSLTIKQKEILFRKIPKYAGQLVNISLDEGKLIREGRTYKFART